jgi:hypothetical protein
MRGKRSGEGARHREGQDSRGARAKAGPSWAGPNRVGLGWAAPRVKIPWHTQPQIGIQFAKQNPKRD